MTIICVDNGIVISHPWHCQCGFCIMDHIMQNNVKKKCGWYSRHHSTDPTVGLMAKPRKGQWRKFPKRRIKK